MKEDEKERIVKDLIKTFDSRDQLHLEYKKRMCQIIKAAFFYVASQLKEKDQEKDFDNLIEEYIDFACLKYPEENS